MSCLCDDDRPNHCWECTRQLLQLQDAVPDLRTAEEEEE